LEKIEYNISRIIQICNKQINTHPESHFMRLNFREKNKIDKLKLKIAGLSNQLARDNYINIKIDTSNY
jgi:hypothetical protein